MITQGFSKLNKTEKRQWLQNSFGLPIDVFSNYDNLNLNLQQLHDDFIENAVANFYLPFGVAPNFCINGNFYAIPMAIEESSVVAGVSKAAKFWAERGGFQAEVFSTEKIGQVHFFYDGSFEELNDFFQRILPIFEQETAEITAKMRQRGGGITDIQLVNKTAELPNYYQLFATFETRDAMGANFINSCLEQFARTLTQQAQQLSGKLNVLMSILSNFVPNCLVKVSVNCPIEQMNFGQMSGEEFSDRFVKAVQIATCDVHRAVTHNKGIMNGIDAVVIATGNDFRAVEAGIHAYASRSGMYQSLSKAEIKNGVFHFWAEFPLALGSVGGVTSLHPMAKAALQILKKPSSEELMKIVASVGLAQNFAAVSSLITQGIQKGHMKMHLTNIINQLGATAEQRQKILEFFKDKTPIYDQVIRFFEELKK